MANFALTLFSGVPVGNFGLISQWKSASGQQISIDYPGITTLYVTSVVPGSHSISSSWTVRWENSEGVIDEQTYTHSNSFNISSTLFEYTAFHLELAVGVAERPIVPSGKMVLWSAEVPSDWGEITVIHNVNLDGQAVSLTGVYPVVPPTITLNQSQITQGESIADFLRITMPESILALGASQGDGYWYYHLNTDFSGDNDVLNGQLFALPDDQFYPNEAVSLNVSRVNDANPWIIDATRIAYNLTAIGRGPKYGATMTLSAANPQSYGDRMAKLQLRYFNGTWDTVVAEVEIQVLSPVVLHSFSYKAFTGEGTDISAFTLPQGAPGGTEYEAGTDVYAAGAVGQYNGYVFDGWYEVDDSFDYSNTTAPRGTNPSESDHISITQDTYFIALYTLSSENAFTTQVNTTPVDGSGLNAGVGEITRLDPPYTNPVTVSIVPDDTVQVQTGTVTIPAGVASAYFDLYILPKGITALNPVGLSFVATGFDTAYDSITVLPDNSLSFYQMPATVPDNGGVTTGGALRTGSTSGDLTVTVSSSNPALVSIETPVITLLDGDDWEPFDMFIHDSGISAGESETVIITLSAAGYSSVQWTLQILGAGGIDSNRNPEAEGRSAGILEI